MATADRNILKDYLFINDVMISRVWLMVIIQKRGQLMGKPLMRSFECGGKAGRGWHSHFSQLQQANVSPYVVWLNCNAEIKIKHFNPWWLILMINVLHVTVSAEIGSLLFQGRLPHLLSVLAIVCSLMATAGCLSQEKTGKRLHSNFSSLAQRNKHLWQLYTHTRTRQRLDHVVHNAKCDLRLF